MFQLIPRIIISILVLFVILSCATIQPDAAAESSAAVSEVSEEGRAVSVSDAEKPLPPEMIMGRGNVSAEKMAGFLLTNNSGADSDFVHNLAGFYVYEAAFEGVNHDIAFIQMCLETGFLRFGGLVQPQWNNFAGLGAIGPEQPGLVFPDVRTGVRAHVQHLKAYGSAEPLNGELVNPRFRYVQRGRAPSYEGLAGTWAADRQYGVKLRDILTRLYDYSF
ncbi:MAG: glucosaminidase domain-containing protein [Treponema sp.]|nr:glucosaminidase domain-containing protein [Treponema sp.]